MLHKFEPQKAAGNSKTIPPILGKMGGEYASKASQKTAIAIP
jgi:hypothetical protein